MELKIRDEYSYFIHTFIIKENKYTKYLAKLLRDERFNLKIFRDDVDTDLYTHFLPKIRSFLFKSFDFSEDAIKKLDKLPVETKAALLAEFPSVTFEYNLEEELQGKADDEKGLFFKVKKMGIVMFNTGVGFLYIKTNVENSNDFADLLDFNNKFKDINGLKCNPEKYENIKIQANSFEDVIALKDFIHEIAGPDLDALKFNLDIEKFYTYSYACIDDKSWNDNIGFDNVKNEFDKFINILPSNSNLDASEYEDIKVVSYGKYSKMGMCKLGIKLFSSAIDKNNYTLLPKNFERKYFYTYLLALYFKVYLKKLDYEFKRSSNLMKVRKKFVYFTKNLKIQEITADDIGSSIYRDMKEVLEIEKIYADVKNKYDILYRESKIEKNEKMYKKIFAILIVTLLFNILNFIIMQFG